MVNMGVFKMKYLTLFCYLLFAFPIALYFLYSDFLTNLTMLLPSMVIFSIILPIRYALSIIDEIRLLKSNNSLFEKIKVNEFLFLFSGSIILNLSLSCWLLSSNQLLHSTFEQKMNPAVVFQNTYSDNSESNNKRTAQIAYHWYGIGVQYKLDSDEYQVYKPTKSDIEEHKKETALRAEKDKIYKSNFNNLKYILYFSIFQITLFMLITSIYLWLAKYRKI